MTASWDELNDVWPWRRVMRALKTVTFKLYELSHPSALLAHAYVNVHRAKGAPPVDFERVLLPSANPFAKPSQPVYTETVIRAFNEAFRRRLTSNAHLSAYGTKELRASGWTGERDA